MIDVERQVPNYATAERVGCRERDTRKSTVLDCACKVAQYDLILCNPAEERN